mgnify:FL=1
MLVFLKKSVWKQNGRKMSRKWSENVENHIFSRRGPTSEVEKIETFRFLQKLIKLHEMTGNDQKSVWEYHLGAETIHFGDLGCPGRYSGVLESDFHVDSQNPKVGVWMRKV